jgi:hypothetical protein
MFPLCRYFFVFIFVLTCAFASVSHAEETVLLDLRPPPEFYAELCPVPVWNHPKVKWNAVKDQRPYQILGIAAKKKNKDPTHVVSQPALEEVFSEVLKKLLQQCGMQWVEGKEGEAAPQLDIVIHDFIAREEKGWFTGKGTAKSRLSLGLNRPMHKTSATVGYEMEFKMGRKQGAERVKEVLAELFKNTVKQIPPLPQLRQLP